MIVLGAYLCLVGLSLGLAAWRRWRFEQALPVAMIAAMLGMYIGGLAGLRGAAAMLLLAAALAGLLTAALAVQNRRADWRTLITPGFAAFTLVFGWVWLAQTGRCPIEWDDFSHWALVVKNMGTDIGGTFGNAVAATTLFRDYPPGLALLQWLAVGQPDMLYRVNSLFLLAMVWPVFARVSWRRWYLALPLTVICLVLPATLFHTPYTSVYADPALGMLLGYVLYAYWDAPEGGVPWGVLAAASAALTLVKPIGVALAALAWLWMALQKKSWRGQSGWRRALPVWPLLAALVTFASWRAYCHALAVPAMWQTDGITPAALRDLLLRRAPAYRYDVIVYFAREFLLGRLLGGTLRVSPAILWLMLSGMVALWAHGQDRARRREINRAWLLLSAAFAIYAGALLLLYVFVFSPVEAVNLASMDRYIGALIMGATAWLVCAVCRDLRRVQWRRAVPTVLLLCALLAALADPVALRKGLIDPRAQIRFSRQALVPFDRAKATVQFSGADEAQARVYVVAQGSVGYEYFQARYMFTPIHVNPNDHSWALPLEAGAPARWAEALRDGGYTHIYLHAIGDDGAWTAVYAPLFADPANIRAGETYVIDWQAGKPKLTRLQPPLLSPDPWETGDLRDN